MSRSLLLQKLYCPSLLPDSVLVLLMLSNLSQSFPVSSDLLALSDFPVLSGLLVLSGFPVSCLYRLLPQK